MLRYVFRPFPRHHTITDGDNVAPITRTYSEKDLGVFFTPDLKFRMHISNIIHKANAITEEII